MVSKIATHLMMMVIGGLIWALIQGGLGLTPGGVQNEIKPLVIKASMAEMVDMDVSAIATTEVNDEGLTKVVVPLLNLGVNIAKRYAKGNGVCMIETDNNKVRPYFRDRDGNKKTEISSNERVTLVVGEPEVLQCGVTAYQYSDGPSLPFLSAPTSLYNGIWAESLHQSVCAGTHPTLQRQARESLASNLRRAYAEFGYQNLEVEFEQPKATDLSQDPSIRPLRACTQRPEPILISSPTTGDKLTTETKESADFVCIPHFVATRAFFSTSSEKTSYSN